MPKFLSDGIFDGLSTDLTVDGKVGIGIALNSSYSLNVGGSINTQGNLVIKTRPVLEFTGGTFRLGDISSQDFPTVIHSNNNVETIRVTGGKVGIAATNPSELLQVGDGSAGAVSIKVYGSSAGSNLWLNTPTNATSINYIGFGDSLYATQNTRGRIAYQSNVSPQGNYMAFTVNRGEIMRLTNSDVGINEDNPSQRLHVDGNVRITGAIYDSNNSPGTSGQVLSSTATGTDWIDQGDVVAGEADKAKSVILRVKNSTASAMSKGQVVCEAVSATPPNGNLIEVALADNNGTNTMPALGILNDDLDAAGGNNDEGDAIMFGKVSGIDTSAFSVGDEVFVDDTPGGLTTTKPTGVKYIQKVGVVIRDDASSGTIEVFGAGRVNDVPTPLYIDHANQRLGVGATGPLTTLQIGDGTADDQARVYFSDGSYTEMRGYGLEFNRTTSYIRPTGDNNASLNIGSVPYTWNSVIIDASSTNFRVNGSDKMHINSSGDVGIGTITQRTKLDINGPLSVIGGTFTSGTSGADSNSSAGIVLRRGKKIFSGIQSGGNEDFYLRNLLEQDSGNNINIGQTGTGLIGDISLSTGSSGNVIFRTTGSESARINSSGYVGIGQTNPDRLLVLNHASDARVKLQVNQTDTAQIQTVANEARYHALGASTSLQFWTNGAHKMRITPSGDVGIATTDPYTKFEVVGKGSFGSSGASNLGVEISSVSAIPSAQVKGYIAQATSGAGGGNGDLLIASRTSAATNIRFFAGSTSERMRINSSGDVGIGNTNPSAKLHVGSSTDQATALKIEATNTAGSPATSTELRMIGYESRGQGIFFEDTGNSGEEWFAGLNYAAGWNKYSIGYHASGGLAEYLANAILTVAGSTARVGIGTSDPSERLEVSGKILATGGQVRAGSYLESFPSFSFANDTDTGMFSDTANQLEFSTGGSSRVTINSSGNVGIGQTNPSTYKLDVSGTIRATGDVIAYSDIRVKENIKTIDNAVDKVKALRGVEYNKIDSTEQSIGVIAQEIEEVIPQVVKEDEEGMKSVAYGNITAVLIEAIKEQQKQIDELKSQLDAFTK